MNRLLQDDKGNNSTMRIVWAISVLTVMFTWSFVCITEGKFLSFEIGDATLIAFLFGGKIGQKYLENKNNHKE